jgi:hypothetical protein
MTRSPPYSLSVALIHNNDPERLKRALPAARAIGSAFGGDVEEISYQPPVLPLSRSAAFARDMQMYKLGRAWSAYRLGQPARRTTPNPKQIWRSAVNHFSLSRRGPRIRRAMCIESYLTHKHIACWKRLNDRSHFILALEDDALMLDNSIPGLSSILDFVITRNTPLVYIDLAGGFDVKRIVPPQLIVREHPALIEFSRIVTNTTCSYLISSALARQFLKIVAQDPSMANLPPDWMINDLAMRLNPDRDSTPILCAHASPSIFVHGSVQGVYRSGLR